jgi:hypothetical protein
MADLPVYPSVTSRHVAHADPAGPLSPPTTVGLGGNSAAFALNSDARLPVVFFRGSFMWFMCSLRPAGSTPCLLPTPPRGDAVGTVFSAEPSNCTGGTCTRVDARFTGARVYGESDWMNPRVLRKVIHTPPQPVKVAFAFSKICVKHRSCLLHSTFSGFPAWISRREARHRWTKFFALPWLHQSQRYQHPSQQLRPLPKHP